MVKCKIVYYVLPGTHVLVVYTGTIHVCTFFCIFQNFGPKVDKSAQHANRQINKNCEFGTNIGFNEYLHMLCRLQLFVGTIARSLMPWWLVGACCSGHMVLLHCWSGGHGGLKWPQFATDKYLLHTCNTVVYNWCGSLKILFL